jgi:DNA-binding response OmpR family regulator
VVAAHERRRAQDWGTLEGASRPRRSLAEHDVTLLRGEPAVLVNPDPDRVVQVGELVIDVAGVSVRMAGERLHLPWREFQVLLLLADNADRVLSAESLCSHIWDEGFVDATGNLKAHIARVRKRMKAHLGVDYIRTVRGMGYVLESP